MSDSPKEPNVVDTNKSIMGLIALGLLGGVAWWAYSGWDMYFVEAFMLAGALVALLLGGIIRMIKDFMS